MSSALFEKFTLRDITFPNRIGLSPMCQYSARDGSMNEWHLAHYGARAAGRPGLILVEAAATEPAGRITENDLGLWDDAQIPRLAQCTAFIRNQGVIAGIQIGHAGRKASTQRPWQGGAAAAPGQGGWSPIWAPSALPFADGYETPQALTHDQIQAIISGFTDAARRALKAGFQVVELHAAHGYLLHQFLSPLTNQRTDIYGGSLENRMRLTCEVVTAVRTVWPEHLPLFVRVSATDWVEGGWDLSQTIKLAQVLSQLGVDLIDTSSGGLVPDAKIPVGPGFQLPFAAAVRCEAGISTAAVGMICEPRQAEKIIVDNQADLVLIGRQMLREPYWPQRAASELEAELAYPPQYVRAMSR